MRNGNYNWGSQISLISKEDLPPKSSFFFPILPLIRWCQWNLYFPKREKRERRRKRREEEENVLELIILHPTIKTNDFLDAFSKPTHLIISNSGQSSHLFSSSSFISIFSSLEPMHLPVFLFTFIISIHILRFMNRTHTSSHHLISFHLFHSSLSFHLMNLHKKSVDINI